PPCGGGSQEPGDAALWVFLLPPAAREPRAWRRCAFGVPSPACGEGAKDQTVLLFCSFSRLRGIAPFTGGRLGWGRAPKARVVTTAATCLPPPQPSPALRGREPRTPVSALLLPACLGRSKSLA